MTNKDFFTKAQGLEKPDVGKKEWGGTIGGPIVRNKLHFFFSLERIAQSRNFTKSFLARPEYSTSVGSEESAWNYLWRIDHQINSKHSWAFRWLQERAPQFNRLEAEQETIESYNDETDFDRTMVGTLTSVVSDTKVNTVRVGFVFEDTVHANPAWRALDPEFARCVPCPDGAGIRITEAAPRLDYDTLDIQAATTMDYSSIQRGYSLDNTFSWFIPEKMGPPRHEVRRAVLTDDQSQPDLERHERQLPVPGTGRHQVRSRQPAVVPGAARHPRARALRVQDEDARRRVLRAGQVADEARPHAERGRALRHRGLPVRTGPG